MNSIFFVYTFFLRIQSGYKKQDLTLVKLLGSKKFEVYLFELEVRCRNNLVIVQELKPIKNEIFSNSVIEKWLKLTRTQNSSGIYGFWTKSILT